MILHKYVNEAGIDIIKNFRLKASDPANLNDPFELCCRVDGKISSAMVMQKYKDEKELNRLYDNHSEHSISISREQFINNAKARVDIIADELTANFSGMVKNDTSEMRKIAKDFYRIVCFSRPINNNEKEVLMWSHYTNGHRGMRIHFDSKLFPEHWKSSFSDMKYRKKRASIDIKDLMLTRERLQKSIDETLVTKSKVWEYENEYRLFLNPSECFNVQSNLSDYVTVKPEAICHIDLGINMTLELQNEICELIKKTSQLKHIQLRKSSIDETHFKLSYSNL